MDTNATATPTAPAAPAPSTPAPAPAPAAAPSPAPSATPFGVRPLIDTSGRQVNPLGQPVVDPRVAQDKPVDANHVSFDDLDKPKGAAKPKDKAEAKDDKKEDVKPDEAEPAKPDAKPAEQTPFAAETPKARDYSKLAPEDLAIAKKLPSKLYNAFMERLAKFDTDLAEKDKALEAAKSTAAQFTHDHPDAYKLDPEFNSTLNDYQLVQSEFNFYNAQLAAAEAGQDWQYVEGYDKDGQPVLQTVKSTGRVDTAAMAQIRRAINDLAQKEQALKGRAQQIRGQYADSVNQTLQHYKTSEAKLFPNLSPEKLTDPAEKNIYDLVMKALPTAESRRPSARIQGLAAVVVYRTNILLQKALERAERAERIAQTAGTAQPINPSAQPATVKPSNFVPFED